MSFLRSALLLRRLFGGFALREPKLIYRELNLLTSAGLLLQLLLQPRFGIQRLLLQSLLQQLLLLHRLLLLLPLLVLESPEHPFEPLIALPRRGGGSRAILELLLHQLLHLLLLVAHLRLLLLQKVKY